MISIYHRIPPPRIADHYSSMLNVTARMAVSIHVLPEWEVNWSDDSPQRDPHTLPISDILPSVSDAAELKKRAVQYVMY